jgi:hypothetical protein
MSQWAFEFTKGSVLSGLAFAKCPFLSLAGDRAALLRGFSNLGRTGLVCNWWMGALAHLGVAHTGAAARCGFRSRGSFGNTAA